MNIYRSFEQWKNGGFLEHGAPRTEEYTAEELHLVEMGWNYGYDAGRAVEQALDKKADNARELGLSYDDEPKIGCVNHDCDKCKAVQEPIGYLFQHEETGLTTVVDVQQVEWGFEKNNPRHQKIGPVYTTPPAQPAAQEGRDWSLLEATQESLREHMAEIKRLKAAQPAPVKTYHDGKPWPVAPKPWVGLTDEEIDLFINGRGDEDDDNYVEPTGDGFGLTDADLVTLVRRAETKLKEKNHG
jgi:hypothetical protein